MKKKLETYIKENSISSDLLFRDWNTFLDVLFECGGSVESIVWFEYVRIDKQGESLGCGGYGDVQNPGFMWAETMLYDENLGGKSQPEIVEHIEQMTAQYSPRVLVPSFLSIKI